MSLDRLAVITCDTDWAPEEIVSEAHSLLCSLEHPLTYFVTGSYRCLLGPAAVPLELGPNPNLEMGEPGPAIDAALALVPGAVSFRAHCLQWSSRLRPILRKRGIGFSSSAMMYLQPALRAYPIGHELIEVPVFWMDAFHLEYCDQGNRPVGRLPQGALEGDGLKVLAVHPIHLVLNTQSLEHYATVKPFYHDPEQLRKARRTGPGLRDVFLELVGALEELDYEFVLVQEAGSRVPFL